MDPQKLRLLLAAANRLRQQGVPLATISKRIQESDVGPQSTYAELVAAVKALPPERADPPPTVGGRALQVAQGATANLLDEAIEGLLLKPEQVADPSLPRTPIGGRIRESVERSRRADPVGSAATEMIGGVLAGTGLVRGLGAGARTAGQRILRTGGAGSVGAGVAGVGEGQTLPERAVLGTAGAVLGVGAGVLLGTGGEAIRFVGGKVANKLVPGRSARIKADNALRSAAEDVSLAAPEFEAQLAGATALRPGQAVPADVPPFGSLLSAATKRASGTRAPAVQRVATRGVGARARIQEDVEVLLPFGSKLDAEDVARGRVREVSARLFRPFDDIVVEGTPEQATALNRVLQNRDVRSVWRKVRPKKGEPLTVERLRDLRSRLRTKASKPTQDAGVTRELRRQAAELDTILEDMIPEFRAANLGYYRAVQSVEAFGKGAKAFKGRLSGERLERQLAEILEDGGPEAKQAFQHGALDEAMNALTRSSDVKPGNAAEVFRGLLEGPGVLRGIFEEAGQLQNMLRRLYLEEGFTVMKNLRINSTVTLEETSQLLNTMQNAQVQGKLAAVYRALNTPDARVANEMANLLVDLLTTPGGSNAARISRVLSTPRHDPLFTALFAGSAAVGENIGSQLGRANEALAPLKGLLESFKARADVVRQ